MTKLIRKIEQIAYHRNGVCGAPFYAVLFTANEDGKRYLASVFEASAHVSVICLDRIADHGVTFGDNSFRGDHFEDELRPAIAQHHGEEWLCA